MKLTTLLKGTTLLFGGLTLIATHDAHADEINLNSTVKVTNSKGEAVTGETDTSQGYKVTFEWAAAPEQHIKEGDTAQLDIPENLRVTQEYKGELKNNEGEVVGTYDIPADGHTANIKFNDYFEKNNKIEVTGTLSFWAKGTTDKTESEYVVNKYGWLSGDDKATWTVVYNPSSETLHNVQVKDQLDGNQTYDGNITVQYGTVENGEFKVDHEETFAPQSDTSWNWNKDTLSTAVRFVYSSKLKGDCESVDQMQNNVETKDDHFLDQNVMASVQSGSEGSAGGVNKPSSSSSDESSTEDSSSTESTTESTESSSTEESAVESTTENSSSSESTESSTSNSEETTTKPSGSAESTKPSTTESNVEESTAESTKPSNSEKTTGSTESSSNSYVVAVSNNVSKNYVWVDNDKLETGKTLNKNGHKYHIASDGKHIVDENGKQYPVNNGVAKLPQTGTKRNKWMVAAGVVLVIAAGAGIVITVKKYK